MAQSFSDFIAKERERIAGVRGELMGTRRELDAKISELDREMEAITAYEKAKGGTTRRQTAARQARPGSRRDAVVAIVAQHPQGLKRGEMLEAMGLKGNKSGEMSVSNALTALVKEKRVVRDQSGAYTIAA